jgi:hypothetical protein
MGILYGRARFVIDGKWFIYTRGGCYGSNLITLSDWARSRDENPTTPVLSCKELSIRDFYYVAEVDAGSDAGGGLGFRRTAVLRGNVIEYPFVWQDCNRCDEWVWRGHC